MKKANNPVRAVETTIQVLEALKELGSASITELADYLDLTKGTISFKEGSQTSSMNTSDHVGAWVSSYCSKFHPFSE